MINIFFFVFHHRMLVTDAIATSGSAASVRVILKKIDEMKITEARAVSIFMTWTNILYDPSVVSQLMVKQIVKHSKLKLPYPIFIT